MRKTASAIAMIFVCASFAFSDVKIGIFAHDMAHVFGNERRETGPDINIEYLFTNARIRPIVGVTANMAGYTSKIYAGINYTIGNITRADVSVGIARHDGHGTRNLGSAFLFRISIAIGFRNLSIAWDHVSNAGFADPNAGLDIVGIVWRI